MIVWQIKPCTTKMLAGLYDVSEKVFRRWVACFKDEIGQRNGIYYTVKQVEIIIDKLGLPPGVEIQYSKVSK